MRRFFIAALAWLSASFAFAGDEARIEVRGIYGGVPTEILDRGKTLADYGVNAVWMGSDGLSRETIALLKNQGARVFAEFNTMHDAEYLRDHPDATPIGVEGKPCPPPDDWQGICPTHPGHRKARMDAFRKALHDFEIDGIWLDYHHAHASWEQAKPNLPDTCFCPRCLSKFEQQTGVKLPDAPTPERAHWLLTQKKAEWIRWRCDVFTDWVREFRQIVDQERPKALLGTFHCPWSNTDLDGALRDKLAIDLKSQAPYFDVLSPMPYHARFGHADDPAWVGRQVAWLGEYLSIQGKPGERLKIWPIIQLADWGERVEVADIETIITRGTKAPSTGAMVFVWGWLAKDWAKVEAMGKAYRALTP